MPETSTVMQSDMDYTLEQISLQGLQRELDDLKESVEYAHQNNICTQTQVGKLVLLKGRLLLSKGTQKT